MDKIFHDMDELKSKIEALEQQQKAELLEIKQCLEVGMERLKPSNLLKSTLTEIHKSEDLKSKIVDAGIGLTLGFISKKVIFGSSRNPIKRVLGSLVQIAIADQVSRHSEKIKAVGNVLISSILQIYYKTRHK